jgi:hypothetical protein
MTAAKTIKIPPVTAVDTPKLFANVVRKSLPGSLKSPPNKFGFAPLLFD